MVTQPIQKPTGFQRWKRNDPHQSVAPAEAYLGRARSHFVGIIPGNSQIKATEERNNFTHVAKRGSKQIECIEVMQS